MKATVFLGGGRITAALLAGLRLANYRGAVVVHDRNLHKLRALEKEFGVMVEPDLLRAVSRAQLLIIAVRPSDVAQSWPKSLEPNCREDLRARHKARVPRLQPGRGNTFDEAPGKLGAPVRWSRAMPSPVARTGTD